MGRLADILIAFICSSCFYSGIAYYGDSKFVWDFRGHSTVLDRMAGETSGGKFGTAVATIDLLSVVGSPGIDRYFILLYQTIV